jgi:hypothetical protein
MVGFIKWAVDEDGSCQCFSYAEQLIAASWQPEPLPEVRVP